MHSKFIAATILAVASVAAPASAAVVVANSTQFNVGYTVAVNDALNIASITDSSGNFSRENAIGLSTLNGGAYGTQGNQGNGGLAATGDGGEYVVFTLPSAIDIRQIRTYSGWDNYRGGQSYTLSYATAAAPTTFIALASEYNDAKEGGNTNTRAIIYDTTGPLATNVIALRWDFNGDLTFGYAGYREFDVFAVPEPATWGLMIAGFGMVGFAARRRRATVAA